jgi:quercetin dioxygenase-like cupin family protein
MKNILFLLSVFVLFPLGAGFGKGEQPTTITELLKTSTSWDGRSLPNYPTGKPEVTIARITIQPGAQLPLHRHPMINAGVLLNGELTVTTSERKTIHLKAGDAIAEVVNTPHYGKNDGKVPAEILVFYAGTVGSPITIK